MNAAGARLDASAGQLVETHLPLVGHLVRETMQRVPAHVHVDDLTSAATTALVLAARNFDPARGVPFGAYARLCIRGALVDELRSMDWASRRDADRPCYLHDALSELPERLRFVLNAYFFQQRPQQEIAAELGVTPSRVSQLQTEALRMLQAALPTHLEPTAAPARPGRSVRVARVA